MRNTTPILTAVHIQPKNQKQDQLLRAVRDSTIAVAVGSVGSGKTYCAVNGAVNLWAQGKVSQLVLTRPNIPTGRSLGFFPGPQPLDTPTLTPTGWVPFGSLEVGDFVVGSNGKPAQVVGIYPKGTKDVYKLRTKQGAEAESCLDHPWFTYDYEENKRGREGRVRSLAEIAETLTVSVTKSGVKKKVANHYLPRLTTVEFEPRPVTVDPYLLGALLGDGSLSGTPTLINPEEAIVARCEKALDGNLKVSSTGIVHRFVRKDFSTNTNSLKDRLTQLGLMGCDFSSKFIPEDYLYNSLEVRLALLQGLMDTDGSCKVNGEAVFHSSNPRLVKQVVELVRSLGGKAVPRLRNRVGSESVLGDHVITTRNVAWDVSIVCPYNPFSLARKAERYREQRIHKDKIISVEYSRTVPVQCIEIATEDHLYVTSNFLLTHNTIGEKLEPWLAPMLSVLRERLGKGALEYYINKDKVQLQPLETIRGCSFDRTVLLVDEAQNLTLEELKALSTRLGTDSRLVLMGDPNQSDLKDSALLRFCSILERHAIPAPVIRFTTEDIVRSDIVGQLARAFEKERI